MATILKIKTCGFESERATHFNLKGKAVQSINGI